jgi:hypothetical protein
MLNDLVADGGLTVFVESVSVAVIACDPGENTITTLQDPLLVADVVPICCDPS